MARITRAAKSRPYIQEFAATLAANCLSKDWRCELEAVHTFVRDEIRYLRDVTDVETVRLPEVTLQMRAGDCDDKCILAASLLESIGHPTRFVAMRFNPFRDFSHVVLESKLGGGWVGMEFTEPWPLGRVPPASERMVVYSGA